MTWFKVDDGFWSHPKTAALSDAAVALWVKAGAYSCQHLTDGRVPGNVLRLLNGSPETAAELVESGLWKTSRNGWVFHDWTEYQETSEAVKTRREQAKERMRKAREAKKRSQDVRANNQRTSGEVREKFEDCSHNPDPTRPDLLTTDVVSSALPRESTRRPSVPIPDEWAPSDVHRAKIATLPAGVDIDAEADAFRNHALANDRRQANWDAAFHNWLGKAKPRERPGQGAATTKAQGWLALANQLPPEGHQDRRSIS